MTAIGHELAASGCGRRCSRATQKHGWTGQGCCERAVRQGWGLGPPLLPKLRAERPSGSRGCAPSLPGTGLRCAIPRRRPTPTGRRGITGAISAPVFHQRRARRLRGRATTGAWGRLWGAAPQREVQHQQLDLKHTEVTDLSPLEGLRPILKRPARCNSMSYHRRRPMPRHAPAADQAHVGSTYRGCRGPFRRVPS